MKKRKESSVKKSKRQSVNTARTGSKERKKDPYLEGIERKGRRGYEDGDFKLLADAIMNRNRDTNILVQTNYAEFENKVLGILTETTIAVAKAVKLVCSLAPSSITDGQDIKRLIEYWDALPKEIQKAASK